MTTNRDDMVFTPRINPRDSGPRRRAKEARELARAKTKRKSILRHLRHARRIQSARSIRTANNARKAAAVGGKTAARLGLRAGARVAGPVGAALLIMDAINALGSGVRRAEGGVSGRLLEAMDQDRIYGDLDELATGAARSRESIEGDPDLLRIIGIQDRVNPQIAELGAWFRERETARAIGADLIEREPSIDHLGSVADKVIAGFVGILKSSADGMVDAIRDGIGKGPLVR